MKESRKGELQARAAHARQTMVENATEARRGESAPQVPAALAGKPDPAEVERWTSYKPAKPPGRT
jgi:hypothetical protein